MSNEFSDLKARQDRLENKIDKFDERLDDMSTTVAKMESHSSLCSRNVQYQIQNLKQRNDEVRNKLDLLETRMLEVLVMVEKFTNTADKVNETNKKLIDTQSKFADKIDNLTNGYKDSDSVINVLTGKQDILEDALTDARLSKAKLTGIFIGAGTVSGAIVTGVIELIKYLT